MNITHESRIAMRWLVMGRVLERLPDGQHLDINRVWLGEVGYAPLLELQARTQAEVRTIRAAFGESIVWAKQYVEGGCNWWEYHGTLANGFRVKIYACDEAPPTCKAIEETVEVTENVPVAWEERKVMKTRTRWECGEAVS